MVQLKISLHIYLGTTNNNKYVQHKKIENKVTLINNKILKKVLNYCIHLLFQILHYLLFQDFHFQITFQNILKISYCCLVR